MNELLKFYKGKKVFLTGHTGFKGTWLSRILILAGAEVTGYSLEPPTNPSIFEQTKTGSQMKSIIGDIRDGEKLKAALVEAKEYFEKVKELDPDRKVIPNWPYQLRMIYNAIGETQKAEEITKMLGE